MKYLNPHPTNLCSKDIEPMISIKINDVCNASCDFCIDKRGRRTTTIDTSKIIEEVIKLHDYDKIIITGGEPFMNLDEVIEVAKAISPYKSHIALNTNGSLLTRESVMRLNGVIDELQISIHHYDEKENQKVFHRKISLEKMKDALHDKTFDLTINSNFHNGYKDKLKVIPNMIKLCKSFGASRLRMTELKGVPESQFASASDFMLVDKGFLTYSSNELVERGCRKTVKLSGVEVSIKRICDYAKGDDAKSFSCCLKNAEGSKMITDDVTDTFKVIYPDGKVLSDWVRN